MINLVIKTAQNQIERILVLVDASPGGDNDNNGIKDRKQGDILTFINKVKGGHYKFSYSIVTNTVAFESDRDRIEHVNKLEQQYEGYQRAINRFFGLDNHPGETSHGKSYLKALKAEIRRLSSDNTARSSVEFKKLDWGLTNRIEKLDQYLQKVAPNAFPTILNSKTTQHGLYHYNVP